MGIGLCREQETSKLDVQSLLLMLWEKPFLQKKSCMKQNPILETLSYGTHAVRGYETTVEMINTQKHCKYQGFVRMHRRHDVPNHDDNLPSNNNTMGGSSSSSSRRPPRLGTTVVVKIHCR